MMRRIQRLFMRALAVISVAVSRVAAHSARFRKRRVPVITQLSAVECGAACLAMILSYWGRKASVAECRKFLGIGRDGVSAKQIADAAKQNGLQAKALRLEPAALASLKMPIIAHWAFNHFVVIERWSLKAVDIVDPAVGRRTLSASEFDENFTGIALTLEPALQFEPRDKTGWPSGWNYVKSMLLMLVIPRPAQLAGQVEGPCVGS